MVVTAFIMFYCKQWHTTIVNSDVQLTVFVFDSANSECVELDKGTFEFIIELSTVFISLWAS